MMDEKTFTGMTQRKNTLTVYDNALGFANTFHLLFNKTSIQALSASESVVDATMIMPTIVNGVFACELFLNALLARQYRTHLIIKLMETLDDTQPDIANRIKRICITAMQQIKRDSAYSDKRYMQDMKTFDQAFEDLRYWHEPFKPNDTRKDAVYNLAFLDVLVATLQSVCQYMYESKF